MTAIEGVAFFCCLAGGGAVWFADTTRERLVGVALLALAMTGVIAERMLPAVGAP